MSFRTLEISEASLAPPGMQFVTVKSAALGQRADVTIYLPPEHSHMQHLPVVTLLHGVYGSHWSWTYQGGAHLTAGQLMREGAIGPMVLVMPSDGLWGDGSGYVKHAHQDFERWIVEEIPQLAARACPAISTDSPQCIAGLSMGGFAALRLAGRYPTRYKAASAHSALTDIAQLDALIEEPRTDWAIDDSNRSVLAVLRSSRDRLPALRLDCGRSDALLDANRQLHQSLLDMDIAHTYQEFEGGHDWHYWKAHLAHSLRFFSHTLQGTPHE